MLSGLLVHHQLLFYLLVVVIHSHSLFLHVALGHELVVRDGRSEDFRDGIGRPVVLLVELVVRDALLREVHDGRARATRADLRARCRIGQVDVYLIATLDSGHWQLVLCADVESLTLEGFNLGDDLVGLNRGALARLDRNVLAFAHDLDRALVAVEKFEADSFVNLIWIIKANSFVRVVLNDPLIATKIS